MCEILLKKTDSDLICWEGATGTALGGPEHVRALAVAHHILPVTLGGKLRYTVTQKKPEPKEWKPHTWRATPRSDRTIFPILLTSIFSGYVAEKLLTKVSQMNANSPSHHGGLCAGNEDRPARKLRRGRCKKVFKVAWKQNERCTCVIEISTSSLLHGFTFRCPWDNSGPVKWPAISMVMK